MIISKKFLSICSKLLNHSRMHLELKHKLTLS